MVAVQAQSTQARHATGPPACVLHLEALARVSGGDRTRAATMVARSGLELLGCDAAFVVAHGERPGVVEIAAAAFRGDDLPAAGQTWELGIAAARLFAHPWRTEGAEREPWQALRGRLGDAGLRSWASLPLPAGADSPAGALVVAGTRPERPCARMDLLEPMAASAAVALAGCTAGERAAAIDIEADERRHALSSLAFGVSHSLGNIFGAILGNLQMLANETDDPRVGELVRRIDESSEAGLGLMQALHDYAVLPGARDMAWVDLSEVAREVMELARALCAPWPALAGVSLQAELSAQCPAWGDAAELRQALVGIVFNAIEAVGARGRITVSTGAEGARSVVTVCDDGPGMTPDVARRSSEPFFTTRAAPHRGLGMTIARGIAVAHRGGVKITRPDDATAAVTLSVACEAPAAVRATRAQAASGAQ